VRGAWCDLKGGASGPLAIMCTRPAPELQWHSGVRMGAGCDLKGGASGPLAIMCTRPAPELQRHSGVRMGAWCVVRFKSWQLMTIMEFPRLSILLSSDFLFFREDFL